MKIGIIGCGKQSEKHISGLIENGVKDIPVTDLYLDSAQALARKFDGIVSVSDSSDSMFQSGLDAVVVATPTPSHAPLVTASINAGVPFLVEKPLSSTVEEGYELARISRDANVPGMVGFIYRQAPVFRDAKGILSGADNEGASSETIGKITSAFFRIGGRGSHKDWKHQKATGGGAITEMLVHMADLATWFFGPFESAELIKNELRQPKRMIGGDVVDCDAEDYALAEFVTKNGVRILIQADMITPAFTQYMEVQGSNGTLESSIQAMRPNYLHLIEARKERNVGRNSLNAGNLNLYIAQCADILEMVKTGKTPPHVATLEQVAGTFDTMSRWSI